MDYRKRLFALLLTLVMMIGLFPASFVPPAYAEVHTESNGIGLGGNNARLTNKYTGNTGTLYGINNHILGGADAFCIDPTRSVLTRRSAQRWVRIIPTPGQAHHPPIPTGTESVPRIRT